MDKSSELCRALRRLIADAPLTYVDCGARGDRLPREFRALKHVSYVGIEADGDECARLNASAGHGHVYIPAFLGRARERRTFHITSSPGCSSLLAPNLPFLAAFSELAGAFRVEREVPVETVTLEDALREHGIRNADFIELDTQGSELDILHGADPLLRNSVLGVRVEVEFSPMDHEQPLFADIDAFLRLRGFRLFDLSRYRVRRPTLAASIPTRGQLLWGHALYLRSHGDLQAGVAARLAVVAAVVDVPDYAAEILERVAEQPPSKDVGRFVRLALEALAAAPAAGGGEEDRVLAASRDRAV